MIICTPGGFRGSSPLLDFFLSWYLTYLWPQPLLTGLSWEARWNYSFSYVGSYWDNGSAYQFSSKQRYVARTNRYSYIYTPIIVGYKAGHFDAQIPVICVLRPYLLSWTTWVLGLWGRTRQLLLEGWRISLKEVNLSINFKERVFVDV